MPSRAAVRRIVAQMIDLVPDDVLDDLRNEDPVLAVEMHYEPIRVRPLPTQSATGGNCSVDGYYEPFIDSDNPLIFYSDAVTAERARFTIIHELGHHVFASLGAALLDDLDRLAGPAGDPSEVEEIACHQFAGAVLVPMQLIEEIAGDGVIAPKHVLRIRERTTASWEAIAVQAATYPERRTAIALVREPGEVSFVAPNGLPGWPRGSAVEPGGPLDRALRHDCKCSSEIYRYGLGGAERLYCDTTRVHDRLAVAVMSPQRSDGGLSLLEPVDPIWKQRDESCEWCGDERDVGWCNNCGGQRCRTCGRCGCQKPVKNPVCPGCHLQNPFRTGARVCRDCETDGVAWIADRRIH